MSVSTRIFRWYSANGRRGQKAVAQMELTWPADKNGKVRREWVPTFVHAETIEEAEAGIAKFWQDGLDRQARKKANAEAARQRRMKS